MSACLIAASTALTTTSCSDSFLDEKNFSSFGDDFDSPVNQAAGLYRQFAALWGQSGNQGFLSSFQVGTDVATPCQVQGVEIGFYRYNELNSENGTASFLWEKLYEIIGNANSLIQKEDAKGDKADKVSTAEAKFFRAYAYDMLTTFYGGVPLELTLDSQNKNPHTKYTRAKVEEVDKQIEADLAYAMQNLPDLGKASEQSKLNKDCARQLAGQVYLRIGMRDNAYYAKAEQVLSEIINSGNYSLVNQRYGVNQEQEGDYFYDMFRQGNMRRSQGNTEGIWTFEMEYNRDVVGGTIDNPQHRRVWVPAYYNAPGMVNADSLGGRGIARLRISNFIKYGLYDKGDIRNSRYNIRRELYLNKPDYKEEIGIDKNGWRVAKDSKDAVKTVTVKTGDKYIPAETDSLANFMPYTTKWGQYDPSDDFGYAMVKDWPLMRLGETYLLRAEARFRQGNLQGAADDINKLRDRAFKDYRAATGDANAGKVSQSQITLDFILDERARELIGEENRRYTLVRTHTLKERIQKNGDKPAEDKKTVGFTDNNYLFPIPLNDVQLNKDAKLEQNPGY